MMKALIIEDDVGVRDFLSRGLYKEKWQIDEAATSVEGEKKLMRKGNAYSVVIVDLMLPDGDGGELVKNARKAGIKTPIIILTAVRDSASRGKLMKYGANDYIKKPFSFNELYGRIEAVLGTKGVISA
jgi:DNA-binding response OmpR family regulator